MFRCCDHTHDGQVYAITNRRLFKILGTSGPRGSLVFASLPPLGIAIAKSGTGLPRLFRIFSHDAYYAKIHSFEAGMLDSKD
jgi:hypothetical protein